MAAAYGTGSYGSPVPNTKYSKVSVAPGYDPLTLKKTTLSPWPTTQPAPGHDSIYNAAQDLATRGTKISQADYDYRATRGQSDYGVQRDAAGNIGAIDPSSPLYNPFSKMALLREHYTNATRGNTNSYAARGQLYSGALSNAQQQTGHEYNQGVSQTINSFSDYLHNLDVAREQGQAAADASLTAAGADEISRHVDDPAVPVEYDANNLPAGVAAPGVTLAPGWKIGVINGVPTYWVNPQGQKIDPKTGKAI